MAENFDIDAIKEKISILDLFTKDGHAPRRAGSNHVACCPFHEEKTPSCHIDEVKQYFHCFGCGESGDAIAYWQKFRGADFQTTLKDLASIAGVYGKEYTPTAAPCRKHLRKRIAEQETFPTPLTGTPLQQWLEAVKTLTDSPQEQHRIAHWRGYSRALIQWACDQGIIGLSTFYSTSRESFLVERPEPPLKLDLKNLPPKDEPLNHPDQTLIPVSSHIRLAPNTEGNLHPKQSWRFSPKGCGSWPLVIGNYQTAKYLFIVEGQWDLLALIDCMGWHTKDFPAEVAIIGLRGAQSCDKFLEHYKLDPTAIAFAFADSDAAGSSWMFKPCTTCPRNPENQKPDTTTKFPNRKIQATCEPFNCEIRKPSFIETLNKRIHLTYTLQPSEAEKDLNDIIKDGSLTREAIIQYVRPRIHSPLAKEIGPTFQKWCKQNTAHPEKHIADSIAFILADKNRTKPQGRKPLLAWMNYWSSIPTLTPDMLSKLTSTFKLYRNHIKQINTPAITQQPSSN
jgi:DNA primase